jgi:hypothetical protein
MTLFTPPPNYEKYKYCALLLGKEAPLAFLSPQLRVSAVKFLEPWKLLLNVLPS